MASPFDRVLKEFKADLAQHEIDDFNFTTAADLKNAISTLQEKQASEKRMQNLRRLNSFIEAMDQYDKVVSVFLNATDYLGFIWGPAKFMLLVASSEAEALNTLLDAYEEIGENLPLLEQYDSLKFRNPYLQKILGFLYEDILKFHHKALKHFRRRAWEKIFNATWKTFRSSFKNILQNLQSHKKLLDSQTLLMGVKETEVAIEELQKMRRALEDEFTRSQEEEVKKRQRTVVTWLSAVDSTSDHDDSLAAQESLTDSGKWLLKQDLIRDWIDISPVVEPWLWINGKPGAGKTILASTLIEECRDQTGSAVAYFYCKHGDSTRNNVMALTRSIILQLAQLKPTLFPFLLEKAQASNTESLNSPKAAKEILNVAIGCFDNLYLVIDGVDECSKAQKNEISSWMRSAVATCLANTAENLHCCFISQDDNDTGRLFRSFPTFTITAQHNGDDILRYCQLQASEIGATFNVPNQEVQSLAKSVSEKADGMFLYAKLVMENLSSQVSKATLRREIESIPHDINQLYYRIRIRIFDESSLQERNMAKRLLSWLLCAKRPLKWHEVQGCICLDPEDCSFDPDRKLVRDVKHFCGSLVEVRKSGAIAIVHLTAKLFLEHEPELPRQTEMLNLTRLCFSQLALDSHNMNITPDSTRKYVLTGHFAFTEYALVHAFDHLHDLCSQIGMISASDYSKLCGTLRNFVARRVNVFAKGELSPTSVDSLEVFKKEDFVTNLQRAAIYTKTLRQGSMKDNAEILTLELDVKLSNVRSMMENMILREHILDSLEPIYGNNLFKCSYLHCVSFQEGFQNQHSRDTHLKKHERSFYCLLNGCHSSMLGFSTAEDLEKHKADYHKDSYDGNSFPWHGTLESLKIVEEIKGGNFPAFELWLSQWEGFIPFHKLEESPNHNLIITASRFKRHRMLGLMVGKIDWGSIRGWRSRKLIEGLLKSHDEETAIQILAQCSQLEDTSIYGLLITSLNLGLDSVTKKLLAHSGSALSDPSKTKTHTVYLNTAIRYGRQAILRELLHTHGVDPRQNIKGRTPLMVAATYNQVEIASYLVEVGKCDKWAADKKGNSALKIAGRQGNEDWILSTFRDDLQNQEVQAWLRTAQLRNAVFDGDDRAVTELLSSNSLFVDELDESGYSPWLWAVKKGHLNLVRIFLQRTDILFDRKFSHRHGYKPGALHFAASVGNHSIMQILLQSGKFLDQIDEISLVTLRGRGVGGTPLDIAKHCSDQETISVIEQFKTSLGQGNTQQSDGTALALLGKMEDRRLEFDSME